MKCFNCSNYVDPDERVCRKCGFLQPGFPPLSVPSTPQAPMEDLRELLHQAFEAGHWNWPTVEVPTRRAAFNRWFESAKQSVAELPKWLQAPSTPQAPETVRIAHARKQGAADGFQTGWKAALSRIAEGESLEMLRQFVPHPPAVRTLELHRCKVCDTRWLLWPAGYQGGDDVIWSLLDGYQRPQGCCDNAAMGEQIEHLQDFSLEAAPAASGVVASGDLTPSVPNGADSGVSRFCACRGAIRIIHTEEGCYPQAPLTRWEAAPAPSTPPPQEPARLRDLLIESKSLLRHEAGCMAGWAEVGVVYKDKSCRCHVGKWAAKVDKALSEAAPVQPQEALTEREQNILCGVIVGSMLNQKNKQRFCDWVRGAALHVRSTSTPQGEKP